jgi:bacterioferritin (cytochrome b1)
MDVEAAVEALNRALVLQQRSALAYTLAAGSIVGLEHQHVAERPRSFAAAELEDARHLVEKIVTLEGAPTTDVAPLRYEPDARAALDWLIESEGETIEAVSYVIEPTGNEGPGEALEHRLEHIIMRKQEQVDFLKRARG